MTNFPSIEVAVTLVMLDEFIAFATTVALPAGMKIKNPLIKIVLGAATLQFSAPMYIPYDAPGSVYRYTTPSEV